MKHRILILIGFLFLFFSASAQFGLKGGGNLSYISGQNNIILISESKVAYQIGIVYKHLIGDEQFAVLTELKFIRKDNEFQIEGYDIRGQLSYLEIPVLGVFNFLDGALGFQAGPQFGFLTGVKYKYRKNGSGDTFVDEERKNYTDFDIGLGLGASLNLDNFFVEIRHNFGLLAIDKDVVVDGAPLEFKAKNFSAELSVGHFF